MNLDKIKEFLFGFLILLAQIILFRHLTFIGSQPDLVLLFTIWLMTREDRTSVILIAAGLAFLQDAFLDLWGLNMFAKTAIAFFAYRFVPKVEEHRLLIWQAFTLIFVIALFHNLIFVGFSFFIEVYTGEYSFWSLLFGNTLYTTVVGTLIYLFRS
jgi:rod shape-determining protein MreD